jgi:hypothetical protein
MANHYSGRLTRRASLPPSRPRVSGSLEPEDFARDRTAGHFGTDVLRLLLTCGTCGLLSIRGAGMRGGGRGEDGGATVLERGRLHEVAMEVREVPRRSRGGRDETRSNPHSGRAPVDHPSLPSAPSATRSSNPSSAGGGVFGGGCPSSRRICPAAEGLRPSEEAVRSTLTVHEPVDHRPLQLPGLSKEARAGQL